MHAVYVQCRYVHNAELQVRHLKEQKLAVEQEKQDAVSVPFLCASAAYHATGLCTRRQDDSNGRMSSPNQAQGAMPDHANYTMQAATAKAAQAQEAAAAERAAAIRALSQLVDEPHKAWQLAVDLAKKYTSAGSAYVANVIDDEEPDWAPPEEAAEGAEGADAETDDEAEHAAEGTEGAAEGEGAEGAAEGEAEPDEEAQAAAAAAAAAAEAAGPDYSAKILSYVAATAGQEFVTGVELRRPKAAADDEEGAPKGADALPAMTFKMLDERLPLLDVPAVALEPRIKFFRGFPRVGGYCAVAGMFHALGYDVGDAMPCVAGILHWQYNARQQVFETLAVDR